MRRTDKEITDQDLISRVIQNAQVCRLGLARDNIPYILPVSFGYDGKAIYFHTAKEGRKSRGDGGDKFEIRSSKFEMGAEMNR